jgi:DNA polymerase III delta prime subunit
MTPEISKMIVGSKVTSHYVMTKEMEYELSRVFDNIQARFTHEVVKRFTDEMIANRWKDVKVEEGSKFFDDTRYTLELFVFNRQELDKFIELIKSTK